MKKWIYLGIFLFSYIGGQIGALISHGGFLSLLSILLSVAGCFAGIWVGYKFGKYMGE